MKKIALLLVVLIHSILLPGVGLYDYFNRLPHDSLVRFKCEQNFNIEHSRTLEECHIIVACWSLHEDHTENVRTFKDIKQNYGQEIFPDLSKHPNTVKKVKLILPNADSDVIEEECKKMSTLLREIIVEEVDKEASK